MNLNAAEKSPVLRQVTLLNELNTITNRISNLLEPSAIMMEALGCNSDALVSSGERENRGDIFNQIASINDLLDMLETNINSCRDKIL